jgi:hypothetical protein
MDSNVRPDLQSVRKRGKSKVTQTMGAGHLRTTYKKGEEIGTKDMEKKKKKGGEKLENMTKYGLRPGVRNTTIC